MVDFSNRLFIQAHSDRKKRAPKPLVVPRPYKRAQEQRTLTATDISKMLGRSQN